MKLLRISLLVLALCLTLVAPSLLHADSTDSALRDSVRTIAKQLDSLEQQQIIQQQARDLGSEALQHAQRTQDRTLTWFGLFLTFIGILLAVASVYVAIYGNRIGKKIERSEALVSEAEKTLSLAKAASSEIESIRSKFRGDFDQLARRGSLLEPLGINPQPTSEKERLIAQQAIIMARVLEALGTKFQAIDYFLLGNAFAAFDDHESALKSFDEAIHVKPDYAEAWVNKGVMLGELGRSEEALKAYDKAIGLKPDYARAWLNKGVALGELGRSEEALKTSEEAIRLKPDYAEAWVNKAAVLSDLRRGGDALTALEEAIRLKPSLAVAWHNKGIRLGNLGRSDEALKALEEAIRLKPDYASAWYNKACAHSLLKNKTEALEALAIAIKGDTKYRAMAKTDKDFEWLWNDEDFKKIVGE
ncbi:tetratricopeptide repeat protein [bacterium]|nr:tetratricopeptide repeat protein [bacterium]